MKILLINDKLRQAIEYQINKVVNTQNVQQTRAAIMFMKKKSF